MRYTRILGRLLVLGLMIGGAQVGMLAIRRVSLNDALCTAVYEGNHRQARKLLEQGADPNTGDRTDHRTPLMLLCMNSTKFDQDLFQYLLDNGANVNARNMERVPVLSYVVLSRRPEAVRAVLDRGADPNARDEFGKTALHSAHEIGSPEIAQLLLDRGARPIPGMPLLPNPAPLPGVGSADNLAVVPGNEGPVETTSASPGPAAAP